MTLPIIFQTAQTDLYQVELDKGQRLQVSLIIPEEILSSIRLPVMTIAEIEYQEGGGKKWSNSPGYQSWILSQQAVYEAPQAGTYQIQIYDVLGEPGKYALILNGNDPLSLSSLISLVFGTIQINFRF